MVAPYNHKTLKCLGKNIATGFIAASLVVGTACPAFASTSEIDAATQALSDTTEVSAPALPSEDTSEPTAERPIGVVNETVALGPVSNEATSNEQSAEEESEEDAQDVPDDPELCTWTRDGYTWSTSRGGYPMTVTNAFAFGVDVSEWQGTIDWEQAKASGVEFAIIRCGYGAQGSGRMDLQFLANVEGCKAAGIPFGIYLYAHATNPDEGTKEAEHVISLLEVAGITPADLMYPVYYDMESPSQKQTDNLGRGLMAENFCNVISEAGFTPGIYASSYWFSHLLTDERFDNYTKWVASYPAEGALNASTSYQGTHDMWQCMSRGVIDGIPGRVDINFDYHFVEAQYAAIYDYEHYVANNPDVLEAFGGDRVQTLLHFLGTGMIEGRDSSPTFNLHGYFNSNPDLRAEYGLELDKYYMHYLQSGVAEGRSVEERKAPLNMAKGLGIHDVSATYDPFVYLLNNPELEETFTKVAFGKTYIDDTGLLKHYLSTGISQGLKAK